VAQIPFPYLEFWLQYKNSGSYANGDQIAYLQIQLQGTGTYFGLDCGDQTVGPTSTFVRFMWNQLTVVGQSIIGPGVSLNVRVQAFDTTNTLIATSNFTITLPPAQGTSILLPETARLMEFDGTNLKCAMTYKNGGSFNAPLAQLLVTYGGSAVGSFTVAGTPPYISIPSSVAGWYSLAIQAQDVSANNLGPALNTSFYYVPAPAAALPLPYNLNLVGASAE
jgi:hypothetical protein